MRLCPGYLQVGGSHSDASDDTAISMKIALKTEMDAIIEAAYSVNDPTSLRHGQFLSAGELSQVSSTSDSSACDVIRSWLAAYNTNSFSCNGHHAYLLTTVRTANRLLKTQFAFYQFESEEPVLRTVAYSLPGHVSAHVDFVFPTVHFFVSGRKRRNIRALQARQHGLPPGPVTCANSICPQNLTQMYNITYFPKDAKSGSKIGIAGFIDNFPNQTDIHDFFVKYTARSKTQVPSYSVGSINNGTVRTPTEGALMVEPNLDLEYALSFTGPIPATFYSVGGRPLELSQPGNKPVPSANSDNEPYVEFFEALLAEENPPQVVSMSYSDDEQSVPIKYAQHVCGLMAKAAARGITIIGSSGDGGAQGTGFSDCVGPDGKHRFLPTFPSSCPWMTSVGATAGYGGPAAFSSGGFSNYFSTHTWQKSATEGYIKALNGSHHGFYNASGRGIPDVSVIGTDYLIVAGGYTQQVKGTSASAPIFAAMIALANDLRLRAGKPVLGHLNPLIYSQKFASAFKDTISQYGASYGCSSANYTEEGWDALQGWDAATGLGEPNFDKLKDLFLQV